MEFSQKTPRKESNLEFWVEFRLKLPNYFNEKTVKTLTCEGLLSPITVSSKTLRLIYEKERAQYLEKVLLPEISDTLQRVVWYILPKIKNIYFFPDDALNKQGCVYEKYQGKFPIIHIKY